MDPFRTGWVLVEITVELEYYLLAIVFSSVSVASIL